MFVGGNQRRLIPKEERKRENVSDFRPAIKASTTRVDSLSTFFATFVHIQFTRHATMVSSRSIFIFATLFLVISSLPVKDHESEMFEATETPIDEIDTEIEATTGAIYVDNAKLLFRNASQVSVGLDSKFDGELLFDQINATYKTPAVEGSRAILVEGSRAILVELVNTTEAEQV